YTQRYQMFQRVCDAQHNPLSPFVSSTTLFIIQFQQL
ncbi:hypothetical protein LTSEMIS_4172, partial [Salmonella enterica subsp. enterica serovar Mississippi str. A4-633]